MIIKPITKDLKKSRETIDKLRFMVQFMPMTNKDYTFPTDTIKGHKIYLCRELTEITPIADTDTEGSVILSDYSEVVDVSNTQLFCDTCEAEGLDIYDTHEISTEWQAY